MASSNAQRHHEKAPRGGFSAESGQLASESTQRQPDPDAEHQEPAIRFIRVTLPLLARKWRKVRPPLA